jgi:hypothetical protein
MPRTYVPLSHVTVSVESMLCVAVRRRNRSQFHIALCNSCIRIWSQALNVREGAPVTGAGEGALC